SYLAKAFQVSHELHLAAKEIELAQRLDPGDPTAWLYAALIHQQQNQINEAVRNLERSQELNDHRQLYRSSLLLDQDRAVRSANLAGVYQDAGFADLSVREAGRAVASDYANYSAHLFLAASYDRLRDPRQINLRYETAWLSEYLVANLLSPVGAGTLSPYISQQEYGKLFERDRLGFASSTEYSSRGDWFQTASQFGLFGNTSYAVDAVYRSENGHRPNNDLEHLTLSLQAKQQLSGHDTLYFQTIYYNAAAGDVSPYYDERAANHQLRTSERQEPIALAGWHHEWQPGIHTLFLAGYLDDTLLVNNPQQQTLLLQQDGQGLVTAILPGTIQQAYRSELEMLSFEGQQIFQTDDHAFIMGGRYQSGKFDVRNDGTIEANSFVNSQGFGVPPAWFRFPAQRIEPSFERWNGYAYLQWQCLEPLRIMGGITLDRLTVPENFRFAPLSSEERTSDFVSPKLGLVWTPFSKTAVRAAFSRSVSGASIDQSFQLEPTQVAGFNQAWRSLIPEAVAAANAGAEFETLSLSIDQNISSGTYFGLTLERLNSDLEREIGVFTFPPPQTFAPPWIFPAQTRSQLDFEERSLVLTLYQLVGNAWSMGFSYRVSRANLRDTFRDIPADAPSAYDFRPHREVAATLHQANPFVRFHHPRGWFAKADAWWNAQANEGYAPGLPGDDFWQFHAHIGYRFAQRRAEVSLGLLNMTGQDYQLNPLNLTAELPHERTLWFSLRLNF
ncbi:MAG: TonB-dependent receptor, partial [Verrucomicrobiota bacterium]